MICSVRTIAQAFNLAFDRWKEKTEEEKLNAEKCEICKCGCRLSDQRLSDNNASSELTDETKACNGTLGKENAGTGERIFTFHEKLEIKIFYITGSKSYSLHCEGGDLPLIDLRSPSDTLEDELITRTRQI